MVRRLIMVFVESRQLASSTDLEGHGRNKATVPKLLQPIVALYFWTQKYLVTPSAFSHYHQQRYFGCMVPTRLETFVVVGYWVLSIAFCGVNYRAFPGNLLYVSSPLPSYPQESKR